MAEDHRKNISRWIADIRYPGRSRPSREESPVEPARAGGFRPVRDAALEGVPLPPVRPRRTWRFVVVFIVCAVVVAGSFAYSAYRSRSAEIAELGGRLGSAYGTLGRTAPDDPSREPFAISSFDDALAAFRGIWKDIAAFRGLSAETVGFVDDANAVFEGLPAWLAGGDGNALMERLSRMRGRIETARSLAPVIASMRSPLSDAVPFGGEHYVVFDRDLSRAGQFLDAFLPWLSGDEPRFALVLFEDPAVLRPGGGSIARFGTATVRRGKVESFVVRDVAEADREAATPVVPPKPLQSATRRWSMADANWFFDFPASASTTAWFAERSSALPPGKSFDVVVSVSPRLVEEIGSGDLVRRFATWATRRDIRLFSPIPAFEQFFDLAGVSGRSFAPPDRFRGDHLAVVAAGIGAGKSDLRTSTEIVLDAQMQEDGTVNYRLAVDRVNRASAKDPREYREPNKSYLQVLVSPGAKLSFSSGGERRRPPLRPEYLVAPYVAVPALAAIESMTTEHPEHPSISIGAEDGKRTFSTWLTAEQGKRATAVFHYATRLPTPFTAESSYDLVLERQPGAAVRYSIEINAPIGFVFRENGLPVHTFESADPAGQETISLTLRPIDHSR